MAGMGPPPKPAATRQRKNRTSTNAVLRELKPGEIEIPKLPFREDWHPQTLAWWRDIWSSPMAPEFHKSDTHGLFVLALVVNDFWTAKSPSARIDASAE